MQIADVVIRILGNNAGQLAIDICTIILFTIYSLMLASPLYIIFTILKYKRKKWLNEKE